MPPPLPFSPLQRAASTVEAAWTSGYLLAQHIGGAANSVAAPTNSLGGTSANSLPTPANSLGDAANSATSANRPAAAAPGLPDTALFSDAALFPDAALGASANSFGIDLGRESGRFWPVHGGIAGDATGKIYIYIYIYR